MTVYDIEIYSQGILNALIERVQYQKIYHRALKAYFKSVVESVMPRLDSNLHIFDPTIKYILLFGSEIGGTFNFKYININSYEQKSSKSWLLNTVMNSFEYCFY